MNIFLMAIYALLIIFVISFIITTIVKSVKKCDTEFNPFIGSWKNENGKLIYTFYENGKFSYKKSGSEEHFSKYKIIDGVKAVILPSKTIEAYIAGDDKIILSVSGMNQKMELQKL